MPWWIPYLLALVFLTLAVARVASRERQVQPVRWQPVGVIA